jgi:hypothetical protein
MVIYLFLIATSIVFGIEIMMNMPFIVTCHKKSGMRMK